MCERRFLGFALPPPILPKPPFPGGALLLQWLTKHLQAVISQHTLGARQFSVNFFERIHWRYVASVLAGQGGLMLVFFCVSPLKLWCQTSHNHAVAASRNLGFRIIKWLKTWRQDLTDRAILYDVHMDSALPCSSCVVDTWAFQHHNERAPQHVPCTCSTFRWAQPRSRLCCQGRFLWALVRMPCDEEILRRHVWEWARAWVTYQDQSTRLHSFDVTGLEDGATDVQVLKRHGTDMYWLSVSGKELWSALCW